MELLRSDIKRLPRLFLGFIILALGIQFSRLSGLGMYSWSVLHEGLIFQTGLSFGVITQVLGLVILFFSVLLLKIKVGIGTICNALFVGAFIDLFALMLPESDVLNIRIIYLALGFFLITFGRSLYISSKLGPGPRDGVFVGLSRTTNIDIIYVKPLIEIVFSIIGFLLGGKIGVGTVLFIVASGYFIEYFFKILHFDPNTSYQSNILDYRKNESQI